MITSGLVVQNHGKGIFPSSRKSSHRMFTRPYTDNFDKPIPTFSRPFDEKFTPTVNYRKVFGKGVTADEKLYYLEQDMYQKIKRVNDLPLNRNTRKKIDNALRSGTLMDKFLFLEKMFKDGYGDERSMEGIIAWLGGSMREPVGYRDESRDAMSLDTRSILRSAPSSYGFSFDEYQRQILERHNPITSELLEDGDFDAIINSLNLTDFDPQTDDLIGDVIMQEGDMLPAYEPPEEVDEDMPPEYLSRATSTASARNTSSQLNNILEATRNMQRARRQSFENLPSVLGARRRSSVESIARAAKRMRKPSVGNLQSVLGARRRDSTESLNEGRPARRAREY